MKNRLPLCLVLLFTLFSCQKIEMKNDITSDQISLSKDAGSVSFQLVSAPYTPHDDDSIERPTTLGIQLTNPYLIPNMQQAYANLGLSSSKAIVNNWYVRFLPSGTDQLATLDSIMDAQGLELFDTPMDYDITYEGDYYQDPSLPDSSPTWQYTVVPPNFVFPSGIQHQTLAQIHIPGDSYTAVETEAERLASIQDSLNMQMMAANGVVHPNVPQCGPGFEWSYQLHKCVPVLPDECGEGYHWDGSMCVPDTPPATDPPPAAPDATVPGGYIRVHDTNLNSDEAVRKARVVAKRWFKIERTYTDNSGHFVFTKKFKHKVRIIEKFKNDDARIYGVRGVRLWQMVFPIKRDLGIYSGDKSNINFVNAQEGPVNSKGNRYWVAATTHNSVQEHRVYSTQFGFSTAPGTMNIYITNWGLQEGLASTPLFHKRFVKDLPSSFANTYLVYVGAGIIAGGIGAFTAVVARVNVDMAIDYHTSLTNFTSDWIKETVYHEMSHASHYTKAGTAWYTQFVNAELAEIVAHPSGNLNPYGDGGSPSNSPIIALGEGWAYHMGHFLADQRYGVNSSCHTEQAGHSVCPNPPTYTIRSNIAVLENFIPSLNSNTDPFHWIPKGLMEDLIDDGEPTSSLVNDLVSGLTISQIFNALQNDIATIPQYKARLLQQISANPTTTSNIDNLFTSYGY